MSTILEALELIEDCMKRESKLTEWEANFIASLEAQDNFTPKQIAVLEKIWDRVTS